MILLPLVFAILALWGLRVKARGFVDDGLCRVQTDVVKGLFIGLVFCSHLTSYFGKVGYESTGLLDRLFFAFNSRLGQLVVVMFLFYSGYGVACAIAKKGEAYIKSMPRHRILGTLLNFDVAVLLFGVLGLALGTHFTWRQFALSLTGWESLGNSNWYIFAIIVFYSFAWIAGHLKCRLVRNAMLFALTFGYILVMGFFKGSWWFDTALAFPLGFCYADYRKEIEDFLKRWYWPALLVILLFFVALSCVPIFARGIAPNCRACLFAMIIVMLSFKIELKSPALGWCGKNLFPLYIYQRIPMIAFATIGGGVDVQRAFPPRSRPFGGIHSSYGISIPVLSG